jgi:SSS family transporter
MGFTTFDYLIAAAYLLLVAAVGIVAGGKQTSAQDYFLGRKNLPWLAVCFAIVATETSTLTFISIPGLAYATNLNFVQVTFGYLLGRIVISFILLPSYARGELMTAYQLLGARFGPTMRTTASVTFMVTRVLADGVRLYATAIPLTLLLKGWQQFAGVPVEHVYTVSIILLAGITLSYTYLGGVRAVIWTDVIQMFVYLGSALGAVWVILEALPETALAVQPEKLSVFSTGLGLSPGEFFGTAYTLPAGLLGGAFLSMASHGTDHIIVQRLLTVRSLSGSQRALIGSGVIVIFQFALFLVIGLLLNAFYGGASLETLGLTRGDEIFPHFILEHIPSGLSGLIIAGLLAAAMSTLSGSVNSLASASINDLYLPYATRSGRAGDTLSLSRIVSFAWCVLLVAVAIFFVSHSSGFLVELALSIASVTYGGMLGVFLLGTLFRKPGEIHALAGFVAGVAAMALCFLFSGLAWTWYTFLGACITMLVGYFASVLPQAKRLQS